MFTSSRKFKGLESDVAIIVDVDVDDSCFLDDEKCRVLYVGLSRTKHFLDIVSVMDDQHVNNMVVQLTGEEKKNARLALASFLKVKLVSGNRFGA
ncbi:MAG: ATP-binding domain-containing protein [Clostridium sp.]|nr:ATP-binding domain-containing protein [Clostridium sp.]